MSNKENEADDPAYNLSSMGANPQTEEAFMDELGRAICRVIASYAELYDRVGVWGFWVEPRENHYNIGIGITNGLASLLPCVPEAIRQQSSIRYAAELEFAAQTYGDVMEDWPEEALAGLVEDKTLLFTVYPARIRKFKAEFAMGLLICLPDWGASLRFAYEQATGAAGMRDLILDWPRDPDKLALKAAEYLSNWLLEPECWRTCRERRLELFISFFGEFVADALNWPRATDTVPKKCFACLFCCLGEAQLAALEGSSFMEECRSIVGTWLRPGKCAAFLAKFDISRREEGAQVTFHGPFANDPAANVPISELIKNLPAPQFRAIIPESAFAAGTESQDGEEPSEMQKAACDFALEVLEFMEVRIQEPEGTAP